MPRHFRPAEAGAVSAAPAAPGCASAARSDADRRRSLAPARHARPAARHRSDRSPGSSTAPWPPGPRRCVPERSVAGSTRRRTRPARHRAAPHNHPACQIPRCFAMKPNFMSTPSRSRPRLFLGCPARPSASAPRAADARSRAAQASSGPGPETHAPDRPHTPSPSCATGSDAVPGHASLRYRNPSLPHQPYRFDVELLTVLPASHAPPPVPS